MMAKILKMQEQGTKFDNDKPQMDLLPFDTLEEVAKVLTFGARKYAPYNWAKGMKYSRLIAACLRHFFKWCKGDEHDPETGLSHLHHAICCLMFLSEYQRMNVGEDDRFKK